MQQQLFSRPPAESPLQPRPYQADAVDAIFAQWDQPNVRSTLAVLATGTGKTPVFALVARRFPRHRGRVLVLAHKDELVRQAVATLEYVCPDDVVEVEQGDRRAARNRYAFADKDGRRQAHSRIVVASKDTMWRSHRLRTFEEDEFGLIVIDEAHHWTDLNKTYHDIVRRFPHAVILGVTATAMRSDGRALGLVFDSVACEYSLTKAIRDGWLVPPIQQYVIVENYDLSTIKRPPSGRDWSEQELDRLVRQETVAQSMAHQIVTYAVQEGKRRGLGRPLSTLIFAASVDHAELMADILNRRHRADGSGRAAMVCGRDEENVRRGVFDRFESHELAYLTNFDIATEGYDNPNIEMLFMGRAVRFVGKFTQILGRGTRPCEDIVELLNAASSREERRAIIAASRKPNVLVIDPVGSTGVHDLSMDVIDVLGGDYGHDVVREAKVAAMRGDGRFLTMQELELAHERLADARRAEYMKRQEFILDCSFTDRTVDPFDPVQVGRHGGGPLQAKAPAASERPVSVQQIALLKNLGIKEREINELRTSEQAQKLIREGMYRRKAKLCTINQRRTLEKFGIDAKDMTLAEAKKRLNELAANGWRRPREPGEEG